MAKTDADWIRLYARRAKKMLGNALAGKREREDAWLPIPETPEDIARYKELQQSADAIVEYIDQPTKVCDSRVVHLMLEFGALYHINAGWGYQRTQPLLRVQKNFRVRRDAANARRRATAAESVRAELAEWRTLHPGLSAKAAVGSFPVGRRKSDRLKKDLVAGLIPEK